MRTAFSRQKDKFYGAVCSQKPNGAIILIARSIMSFGWTLNTQKQHKSF